MKHPVLKAFILRFTTDELRQTILARVTRLQAKQTHAQAWLTAHAKAHPHSCEFADQVRAFAYQLDARVVDLIELANHLVPNVIYHLTHDEFAEVVTCQLDSMPPPPDEHPGPAEVAAPKLN